MFFSPTSLLYYTDWGSDGSVRRSALDGSDSVVLRQGLDNPNGVAVQGDTVS